MKYRKKPVEIEAITYDELFQYGLQQGNIVYDKEHRSFFYKNKEIIQKDGGIFLIPTLEGTVEMTRDCMLITGVQGEIYPCRLDIFKETYEKV